MLEYEAWGMYDAAHEQGYQTGHQTIVLETMIDLYRTRHKAPDEDGVMRFFILLLLSISRRTADGISEFC